MTLAMGSVFAGSLFEDSTPSTASTSSGFLPNRGERASVTAKAMTCFRMSQPTHFTADPTLAAVCEPPETGVSGKFVSPSSKRTLSREIPSASAAIWVMIVYVPVPMSCEPARTSAVPSARRLAQADARPWWAG